MNKTDKFRNEKCYLTNFKNHFRRPPFIFLFLLSTQIYAQQETKPISFGIQAGINGGILGGGLGPSISFHYALRTEKVLQLESMLFFDSHSGETFLSGYSQKNIGLGLAVGARVNVLPKKNWNPSFVIMPGVIYSSQTTSRPDDNGQDGISGALCLGISSAFYRKHMVSIGLNIGDNIDALYIKYGLWFREK